MPQMNFFNARLEKDGSKYLVAVGGVKVELSEEKQKALAAKNAGPQEITLGVRPDHILLGGGPNALTARVDLSEMMGSAIHLHVNAEGRDVVIIIPTLEIGGSYQSKFGHGAEVQFSFHGGVCHVFDQNGRNLEF